MKEILPLGLALFAASGCTAMQPPLDENEIAIRLSSVSGRVLVHHGQEFAIAQSDMALQTDDRVIAMGNSSATLVYIGTGNKTLCELTLPSNSQLTVTGPEDCSGRSIMANDQATTPVPAG